MAYHISEPHYRFRFSDAFAFSETGLDPHRITSFLNEFATNVLVTGHNSSVALPTALSSSSTAQFTGILHLRWVEAGVQMERFERLHPTTRPNGSRFPQQCPKCCAYRPWVIPPNHKKKNNNKEVVFKCATKGCSGVFKVGRLKGYRSLPKDGAKIYSKKLLPQYVVSRSPQFPLTSFFSIRSDPFRLVLSITQIPCASRNRAPPYISRSVSSTLLKIYYFQMECSRRNGRQKGQDIGPKLFWVSIEP